MKNVMEKAKQYLGLDEDFEENEVVVDKKEQTSFLSNSKKGGKVVNINSAKTTQVLITKPKTYEESKEIAEALKSNKIAVINATSLDAKVAQRLVDFIGGAAYMFNADLQEIETRIYLLTPSNTEVISETKNDLAHKALFKNIENEK